MTDPLPHIENRLNALMDELRGAYSHHSIPETIYDAIGRGSQVQQRHMLFFGVTLGAHTEAMLSCLFRLVDKRKDAISVENFLHFVLRHAKVLPHSSVEQVRQRVARDFNILSEIQPLLDGLRGRRNKVGAHVSLNYLPDLGKRVREDYPLHDDAIETVLQELDFILGHYREFLRDSPRTSSSRSVLLHGCNERSSSAARRFCCTTVKQVKLHVIGERTRDEHGEQQLGEKAKRSG